MKLLAHSYVASASPIPIGQLAAQSLAAHVALTEAGYAVRYGLTKTYADQLIAMAQEPGIREYCPNDAAKRFKDHDAVQAWLAKGRVTFLLLHDDRLAGYGWIGESTEKLVPGGSTTFAIRIGETHQGKGLAVPFMRVILATSDVAFAAGGFWLETWRSNGGAVHTYHKVGFKDVTTVASTRPTITGEAVADTRIYMSLGDNDLNL